MQNPMGALFCLCRHYLWLWTAVSTTHYCAAAFSWPGHISFKTMVRTSSTWTNSFQRLVHTIGGESITFCLFGGYNLFQNIPLTCNSNHTALATTATGQAIKMRTSNQHIELQQEVSAFDMMKDVLQFF
jgi:hypothetical protein